MQLEKWEQRFDALALRGAGCFASTMSTVRSTPNAPRLPRSRRLYEGEVEMLRNRLPRRRPLLRIC